MVGEWVGKELQEEEKGGEGASLPPLEEVVICVHSGVETLVPLVVSHDGEGED